MPIINHVLTEAEFRASPFYDERPIERDIRLVVIHCISLPEGQYGTSYIDDLFMGCVDCDVHPSFESLKGVKVSAHVVIDRQGKIKQYVPFHKRAWHAGVSNYQGESRCNDFSIGIELEGTDRDTYTEQQYEALNSLLDQLFAEYDSLTAERVVGHSHIAPGRKTDPGVGFDWSRIKAESPL
ncbi:N-acetylmuramoyl-L-alanine amidase [Pseudoalteromonas luteoviolacea B = ATCC 29581]|nr:N-acetylmuramoyl-L-alanine amidase [Pseudoalteromonas luteoviolacea B = ATCC 29581]